MDLKSTEGRATLAEDTVILTFDNKMVTPPDKQAASPRIIPLKHVLEVDFSALTTWKPPEHKQLMDVR